MATASRATPAATPTAKGQTGGSRVSRASVGIFLFLGGRRAGEICFGFIKKKQNFVLGTFSDLWFGFQNLTK